MKKPKSEIQERQGMLIVIQGLHGTGKTHLATLLKNTFEAAGRKVMLVEDFHSPESSDANALVGHSARRVVIVTVGLRKAGQPRGTGVLQAAADVVIQPVKLRL